MIIPNSFYLYDDAREFTNACRDICLSLGMTEVFAQDVSDVAIAPRLTRKLPAVEYDAPFFGTLVFHPSALPYRRGPDAIRHTAMAGERVSAATWFWCAEGWDTGDICEQEVVVLNPSEGPGHAYHARYIPAGLRALERALIGILAGSPRRVPQPPDLATYDPPFAASRSAASR
jgi:methionyl-tRNA formyltransferase